MKLVKFCFEDLEVWKKAVYSAEKVIELSEKINKDKNIID